MQKSSQMRIGAAAFFLLSSLCFFAEKAKAETSLEWDALIAAAQKEGKLEVILSGQVPQKLKPAMTEFEKKYRIKVNFQTGGGSAHAERLLAERKLGRYTLDIWLGGANTPLVSLVPAKVLASLPEMLIDPSVKDPSRWYKGKHHYTDPEGRYVFTYGASPNHAVSFNTNLVKADEIKSYHDLLDPKWKGKIVSWSPGDQGTAPTSVSLYLNPKIGDNWYRRWANEMNVTIVKDARQGAEWLAMGRFHIGMFGLNTQSEDLANIGFPIQGYLPHPMLEGDALTASASNLMVLDKAPNPNAAKLFINWALGQEAQTLFVKLGEKMDSLRVDVDNSTIEEHYRIRRDQEYWVSFSDENYINRQTEILKRLREIMREAGYK